MRAARCGPPSPVSKVTTPAAAAATTAPSTSPTCSVDARGGTRRSSDVSGWRKVGVPAARMASSPATIEATTAPVTGQRASTVTPGSQPQLGADHGGQPAQNGADHAAGQHQHPELAQQHHGGPAAAVAAQAGQRDLGSPLLGGRGADERQDHDAEHGQLHGQQRDHAARLLPLLDGRVEQRADRAGRRAADGAGPLVDGRRRCPNGRQALQVDPVRPQRDVQVGRQVRPRLRGQGRPVGEHVVDGHRALVLGRGPGDRRWRPAPGPVPTGGVGQVVDPDHGGGRRDPAAVGRGGATQGDGGAGAQPDGRGGPAADEQLTRRPGAAAGAQP